MWKFLTIMCLLGSIFLGGYFPVSFLQAIIIALVIYICCGGYYTLWLAYKTLPRDFGILWRYIKIRKHIKHNLSTNTTVAKIFMQNTAKHPNKAAFIFEGKKWTFSEMDEYSNRIANYLISKGLRRQDSVALFMENRPEYVATWIGCAKISVATALVNSNLRLTPLLHSIKVANAKAVICGAELQNAIKDLSGDLEGATVLVSGLGNNETNVHSDFVNLDKCLSHSSPTPPAEVEEGNVHDKLLYIYTSGTTGLPKAAVIKDFRYSMFSSALHYLSDVGDGVVYNPLPLYHTAGGLIGAGQAVIHGCTVVIRKKFSVSNFWSEAAKYECTVAQYIGEICRYLLNAPPKPEDKQHKIRVMMGNGLRPQIWEEFVERFKIPRIAEIYGSTEGVTNLMNFDGKPGACGFLPVFFSDYFPGRVIRINTITGEIIRGIDGLCIRCKPGEPGLYVGMIKDDPTSKFHGYADKKATEKKILRDVAATGDSAYMSGDILVMDEFGYVYFKDRLGDTFRWRGENVSTSEVEGVVSQVASNRDAAVYGVEVAQSEGRAGMAAIVDPRMELNVEALAEELPKYLPSYAIPLFLRIVDDIDKTGTYKLKKLTLQKEGYNPRMVKDKMYYFDAKKRSYVALTEELYDKIDSGNAGL